MKPRDAGPAARRTGLILALIVILSDQWSKWWIVDVVMSPPRVMPLNSFLNIVLVQNRGVSFGLFSAAPDWLPWALAVFALLISAALAIWLWQTDSLLLASALGLVIGGALGNVVDRIRYGTVVDFLDFHLAAFHWPAFNVADSAITIGVGLLLLDALKSPAKRR